MNFDTSNVSDTCLVDNLDNRFAEGVITVTIQGYTPRSGKTEYEGKQLRWWGGGEWAQGVSPNFRPYNDFKDHASIQPLPVSRFP